MLFIRNGRSAPTFFFLFFLRVELLDTRSSAPPHPKTLLLLEETKKSATYEPDAKIPMIYIQ